MAKTPTPPRNSDSANREAQPLIALIAKLGELIRDWKEPIFRFVAVITFGSFVLLWQYKSDVHSIVVGAVTLAAFATVIIALWRRARN
jgi:hypothetical protein